MSAIRPILPNDMYSPILSFLPPSDRAQCLTTSTQGTLAYRDVMERSLRTDMVESKKASLEQIHLYNRITAGQHFSSRKVLELDLSWQGITVASLTDLLHRFPDLESLNLSGCIISDPILHCLQHARGLKSLDLSGCTGHSGNGLQNLQFCPGLKRLILNCYPLCQLQHLAHCPHLEELSLNDNWIANAQFSHLQHVPNLKKLHLENHELITRESLRHLRNCPELEFLDLTFCGALTNPDLQELQHWPNLKELSLSNCAGITQRGLESLRFCQNLEKLDLCNLRITDVEFAASCPQLKELNLSLTSIRDEGLTSLESLSQLRVVNFIHCLISDRALDYLHNCRQLRHLLLEGTEISDKALLRMRFWPYLERLDLARCKEIRGTWLSELKRCKNIRELDLSNSLIEDSSLAELAYLPRLETLTFNQTNMTDVGVERLLLAAPDLRSLSLWDCKNITDKGVRRIQFFKNLETLILSANDRITDMGILHLQFSPYLRDLFCLYCPSVSREAFRELENGHLFLKIVSHRPGSSREEIASRTVIHALACLAKGLPKRAVEAVREFSRLADRPLRRNLYRHIGAPVVQRIGLCAGAAFEYARPGIVSAARVAADTTALALDRARAVIHRFSRWLG